MRTFALFLFGALATDATAQSRDVAGCYVIEFGAWTSGPYTSQVLDKPVAITLDTTRITRGYRDSTRRVVIGNVPGVGTRQAFPPSWAPVRGDSVQLIWSNGFSGIQARVEARADSMRGIAERFSDYITGDPLPRAPVLLRRTPCSPR